MNVKPEHRKMDWLNPQQLEQQALDDTQRLWLTQPKNLTACLRATQLPLEFKCLSQSWQTPVIDEQRLLSTQADIWRREIIHFVADTVYVYAYVSIPRRTYQQYQQQFDSVGNLPIGENLLYITPEITRSPFQFKALPTATAPERVRLLGNESLYWARNSLFDWSGYPLSITEIFSQNLPPFPVM